MSAEAEGNGAGGIVVLVRRCSRGAVEVRLLALALLRDLGQLGHSMPGEPLLGHRCLNKTMAAFVS